MTSFAPITVEILPPRLICRLCHFEHAADVIDCFGLFDYLLGLFALPDVLLSFVPSTFQG